MNEILKEESERGSLIANYWIIDQGHAAGTLTTMFKLNKAAQKPEEPTKVEIETKQRAESNLRLSEQCSMKSTIRRRASFAVKLRQNENSTLQMFMPKFAASQNTNATTCLSPKGGILSQGEGVTPMTPTSPASVFKNFKL